MKKLLVLIIVIGIGIVVGTVMQTKAESKWTPGSVDDPIITKSYLDEQLKQVSANGGTSSALFDENRIKKLVKQELAKSSNPTQSKDSVPAEKTKSSAAASIVKLEPNQILFAGAGSEFIVRTGKTIIISSDENGVADLTAGKDLLPNSVVENNHLLLFPREGRGIKPDSKQKTEIYVMVKGSYLLHENEQK